MCCNTKPGPQAAIAFFRKKTGVHVTQEDWHKIRKAAEVHLGRPLSNNVADSRRAAMVAAEFADSLNATPAEKRDIIFELASTRTTEGTVDTIAEIAVNGVPAEVANKKGRKTAHQKAVEEREAFESGDTEKSVFQRADIKLVGVSNYAKAVSEITEDENLIVEHEPDNQFDGNAMRVRRLNGDVVGYLPASLAARVLEETGEKAFLAHLTQANSYDGKTVGGLIRLDSPVEEGWLEANSEPAA
jgi:hypothetical protein